MSDRTLISGGGADAGPFPADATTTTARTFGVFANTITATLPPTPPPPFKMKGWLRHLLAVGVFAAATISTALLVPSITARRVSGTAPLNVHFNTLNTTSTQTADSFRRIFYWWDFGETTGPGVAQWARGIKNKTRNQAHGPIAAHLYEVPGTYTATVYAMDGVSIASEQVVITVDDPEVVFAGKTWTYANSGATAGTHINVAGNFDTVVNNINSLGNGYRHQLNRGDVFTATTTLKAITSSNGTLEPYGAGANPIIQLPVGDPTRSNGLLVFGGQSFASQTDWRVVDLTFDGSTTANTHTLYGVFLYGGVSNVTVVRPVVNHLNGALLSVEYHPDNFNDNLGLSVTAPNSHKLYQGTALYDATLTNVTQGIGGDTSTFPYGSFIEADYLVVQGCDFDLGANAAVAGWSHCLRIPSTFQALIANNNLERAGQTEHSLKLHASTAAQVTAAGFVWADSIVGVNSPGGGATHHVWITDNYMEAAYTNAILAAGPPSGAGLVDTLVNLYSIGIVGNLFYSGTNGTLQSAVWNQAPSSLVGNNIFCLPSTANSAGHVGVALCDRSQIFGGGTDVGWIQPTDCIASNNSYYCGNATTGTSVMVFIAAQATNAEVENNAMWSADSQAITFAGSRSDSSIAVAATGFVQGGNSSSVQTHQGTSPFTGSPPTTALADWVPAVGSYLLGAGVAPAIWKDINGVTRAAGSDIGAVERGGSLLATWELPTLMSDGSPIGTITGINVYFDPIPRMGTGIDYADSRVVSNPAALSALLTGLTPATTYYYAVTVTVAGVESDYGIEQSGVSA